MFVYSNKSESKYLGNFIMGDSAPSLSIIYKDGINIALVSKQDFDNWFSSEGIGMLRDFDEYKNDMSLTPKKLISIKSSKDVTPNTMLIDSKYKSIFGSSWKCIPVSKSIRVQPYIKIYLSSDSKIKIYRDTIINELHQLLDGLVVSKYYNDIVYVTTNIKAKIFNIDITGIIDEQTSFHFSNHTNIELAYGKKNLKIEPVKENLPLIILKEEPKHFSIDFSKLKVGGSKKQLEAIANVLRPRGIDQKHLDEIGMTEFERGIMLYGPAGTGKTLIARELSYLMGIDDFNVVNGPELLNKYVGESEANIRNILRNYSSNLKVVFFDEFDCIAKERTSSNDAGSNVGNNIVNQILSIMDGVHENNNLLIIAATNRLDVIDPALLRPGRFGLCLHIGLPEKKEREEIFKIHLSKNMENKNINIDMEWLATQSENYTGAEIKGIVKKARELALAEAAPDLCNLDKIDVSKLKLNQSHFQQSFKLIKCGFSGNVSKINELLPCGNGNASVIEDMMNYYNQMIPLSKIYTYLLTGNSGTYKSSSCRMLCEKIKYDSVYIITDNMIRELSKIDCSNNKNILIILDSLENLCGILNCSSYNAKNIEFFNKFTNKVVNGKILMIATMRIRASITFNTINPSFEWHHTNEI